jgi:hypothetical protein
MRKQTYLLTRPTPAYTHSIVDRRRVIQARRWLPILIQQAQTRKPSRGIDTARICLGLQFLQTPDEIRRSSGGTDEEGQNDQGPPDSDTNRWTRRHGGKAWSEDCSGYKQDVRRQRSYVNGRIKASIGREHRPKS